MGFFFFERTILHELKAFYPRTQITRISLNFSDFFLPIPAGGKISSHFDMSMHIKFSTSMTRTHQSEEVFAGRDTRNRLKDKGKVNTSARGHGNTATNTWAIFSHCVGIFLNHQSLPNRYLHVFCCDYCKSANVSFFSMQKLSIKLVFIIHFRIAGEGQHHHDVICVNCICRPQIMQMLVARSNYWVWSHDKNCVRFLTFSANYRLAFARHWFDPWQRLF